MEMSNNSLFLINKSRERLDIDKELSIEFVEGAAIVGANSFLAFVGACGNFLIIFAVLCTPQLRQKPSNVLLLSLAVTDLVVTMVAQPLFVVSTSLKTFEYRCSLPIDMVLGRMVPFLSFCSAIHLAVISIDRALAAVKPHQYAVFIRKWTKVMLFICWSISLSVLVAAISKIPKVNYFANALRFLSLIVISTSYGMVLKKIKCSVRIQQATQNSADHRQRVEREKRLSMTIAIVIFLFIACWLPPVVYSFVHSFPTLLCNFNATSSWMRTVFLANSSMNFIVYSLRIRRFRKACGKIARRICPVCTFFF